MNLINSSNYQANVSTLVTNSTHFPAPTLKMIIVVLLFISSIIGTITNGLYLWILKFKMKKTVNTLLFFHFVLSHFISSLIVPIITTSFLQDNHWRLGNAMCKVFNGILHSVVLASVFFLSAVSVDRYLLTLRPVWVQLHRGPRWAASVILGVWLSATAFSIPYFVFQEAHADHEGRVTCQNNYAVSTNWGRKEMQTERKWIHVACFTSRFLLSFLLPFFIITFCYIRVANKMKKRSLSKSSKPFKVMMTAVISFFVCWLPYHVYKGLLLTNSKSVPLQLTMTLAVITTSFNIFFSPTLYLFVGENFKKSILALFESTFCEDPSPERTQNLNLQTYI